MALSSATVRSVYNGNGSTTSFGTGFKFFDNSDVKVILRDENVTPVTETTWTEGTEYTLTGAGNDAGGTVTVSTSPTDYTPASGEKLIIKSDRADLQPTALPLGGSLPSTTIVEMVDKAVRLSQQQAEEIGRALAFPETDASSLSPILPASSDRATYPLAFDSDGEPAVGAVTMAAIEAVVNAAQEVELNTMPVGTAGAPGLPFSGDSDTGIYRPAANQLGVSLAGAQALLLSTTALTYTPGDDTTAILQLNSNRNGAAEVVAHVDMHGHDSAGNDTIYGALRSTIVTATDGSEDGRVSLHAMLSGTLTQIAEFDPTDDFTFILDKAGYAGLEVRNNGDAANGAEIALKHNTASPADSDIIGHILFRGQHDGSVTTAGEYDGVELRATADDVTEATEDIRFSILSLVAGASTLEAHFGNGVRVGGNLSIPGAGILNAQGLQVRDRLLAGWEQISETDASVAAAITFSGLKNVDSIDDAYEAFAAVLENITPVTDDDDLRVRVATGASAIDTGTNYDWSFNGQIGSTASANSATGGTSFSLTRVNAGDDVGNVAGEGMSGVLYFTGASQTTVKRMTGHVAYKRANAAVVQANVAGWYTSTGDELDDISFLWGSGGNFQALGRITLYGLRRATS